jgi:tetratricopeptide (TPR) repeat protein
VSETARIETATARDGLMPQRDASVRFADVRVSPGGYLTIATAFTFAALLLVHIERNLLALVVLALSWLLLPLLAFTDRIFFDGYTLRRKGPFAFIRWLFKKSALQLQLEAVERVETLAVRTLRRGGKVRYRYRSEIKGGDVSFVFASGGKRYRQMVRALFTRIPDEKMDARSTELRDYLVEPDVLRDIIKQLHLAPVNVLEGATLDLDDNRKSSVVRQQRAITSEATNQTDIKRAILLRQAANELRVVGRLRESAEAFRRALLVLPRDAWLIYEWARLLRSQASASGRAHLLRRSRAALKLAARHADKDAKLLARIGESLFEHGDWQRAARMFQRALEANPETFCAELGLAEIALRSGQLAHAVHRYAAAAHVAQDEALARFARREADYYARLTNDEDYLAKEVRRINLLQGLHRSRKLTTRVILAALFLALAGPFLEESIAAIGWAFASSSVIAWIVVTIAEKIFAARRAQ